jgi:hypothetical protein
MLNKPKDQITFVAVDVDNAGNYITDKVIQDAPGGLTGEGMPVTRKAAKAMIRAHWNPIKERLDAAIEAKDKQAIEDLLDTNIAATFGKETLLFILSQENCDGLRFYFATKPTTVDGEDIPGGGGLTIVVTGVKEVDGKAIDLNTNESIMEEQTDSKAVANDRQGEVVPPTRIREILHHLRDKMEFTSSGLEKSVVDFFDLDRLKEI